MKTTALLLVTFSLFFPGGHAVAATKPTPQQPNIIVILADDLGYECIGANGGNAYQTPHLDGLAHSGVRFEQCYAQPNCTPTRVQMMTGMSNVLNYVSFGALEKSQTTFGRLFRDAGYATCIAGKWQLGSKDALLPRHFGFPPASARREGPAARLDLQLLGAAARVANQECRQSRRGGAGV